MKIPLWVYADTFSGQLHFQRVYFFTVSTSWDQPLLQSNYSPKQHLLFSEELLLQDNYSFGADTFLEQFIQFIFVNSYFFRRASFSEQNFYRAATSWERMIFCLEDELAPNKDIYREATFWEQVYFHGIAFCRTASFLTNLFLQKRYFFKRATFWKQLIFRNTYFRERFFSEQLLY